MELLNEMKYILTTYEYAYQNILMIILHIFLGLSFFPLLFA